MRKNSIFSTSFPNIQSHGQLIPMDVFAHIHERALPGMKNVDYQLGGSESLGEALNRSWNRMLALWRNFENDRAKLTRNEAGSAQTRKNFLLPLFQELGYGNLDRASPEQRKADPAEDASYPFSHIYKFIPIHLLDYNISLDQKSAGVKGAARHSPHSMLQEFLNRSQSSLWGMLSNGLSLRLLRKNASLGGQAYVEFQLQDIFRGESFSEFALLWLTLHQSRLYRDKEPPEKGWLELWRAESHNGSVAALDSLRDNAREAMEHLGRGFLAANPQHRLRLKNRNLNPQDYFRQLLRLVWRFIFLFVIEERNLLYAPGKAPQEVRDIYSTYWSLSRLGDLSMRLHGDMHHDLWEGLKFLMRSLGQKDGCPPLGLSPLGGFLWSDNALPDLAEFRLFNRDLLAALRALAWTRLDGEIRPVDWRHLGALELGSIYESLLELQALLVGETFSLVYASGESQKKRGAASGGERKSTGSYYTPTPLIERLLDDSLEPLIQKALASPDPEAALLNIKICDPACGSGHFLLAAAKRLALRLARLKSGDSEPSPGAIRGALRNLVNRSIYGIDINPLSLEICKLGFWLETHEPGKALGFLDHHLVCANSLIGANSAAIRAGLPEAAYNEKLEGSDKEAVKALKKFARSQTESLNRPKFAQFGEEVEKLIKAVQKHKLEDLPANSLAEMEEYEKRWRDWQKSPEWRKKKFLYDLWTAAFVLPAFVPEKDGPLSSALPCVVSWQSLLDFVNGRPLDPRLEKAVSKASLDYQFFHMELMFPEVAEKGGFDLIIGNPPWNNTLLKQKAWFGAHNRIDIASLPGKERERAIKKLAKEDPTLFGLYRAEACKHSYVRHFYKNSGQYPLCSHRRINLYAIFAEWMRQHINPSGLMACIVPTGIVTDFSTRFFFQDLMRSGSLLSVHDFENHAENGSVNNKKNATGKSEKYFATVDSRFRFCLLTCGSGKRPIADKADFVFLAHNMADLDKEDRRLALSHRDIALINPNTLTAPIFLDQKELALARAVYGRFPVLDRDGAEAGDKPWKLKFSQGMLNMTSDSGLFHKKEDLEREGWQLRGNTYIKGAQKCLPIYEGKMIHHFNYRWATSIPDNGKLKFQNSSPSALLDQDYAVLPRYWIYEQSLAEILEESAGRNTGRQLTLLDSAWNNGDVGEPELDNEESDSGEEQTVADDELSDRIENMRAKYKWLFGLRGITNPTNERTLIGGVFPMGAVGNSLLLLFSDSEYAPFLPALLSSLVCDFFLRRKLGGTNFNKFHARQLAVPGPEILGKAAPWQADQTLAEWLRPRILELTFNTWEMRPYAEELGYTGPPFPWDVQRREEIAAELNAAFFHLYLPSDKSGDWARRHWRSERDFNALKENFPSPRDAVSFILETFPLLRKNEIKEYKCYRSRDMILEAYDRLAKGII